MLDSDARKNKAKRFVKDAASMLTFVAVLLVARATLADHYTVPTSSMSPTIRVDDRLVVNKAAYGIRLPMTQVYLARYNGPQHGDVVVLDSPDRDNVLLKRVVACPGDEVRVLSGRLYINREDMPIASGADGLEEDLLGKRHRISLSGGGGPDFGPEVVPQGSYLVMGDNRGQSLDGRLFGFVDGDTILGKAVAVYFRDWQVVWETL